MIADTTMFKARLYESFKLADHQDPEGEALRLSQLAMPVLELMKDRKWRYPDDVVFDLNKKGISLSQYDAIVLCCYHEIYWHNFSSHEFERGTKYKIKWNPPEELIWKPPKPAQQQSNGEPQKKCGLALLCDPEYLKTFKKRK
jgi:hypothetical protein